MKLGPVTKLNKKNKTTSAKCWQFGAIRKPGSGRIVCKIYIFINSNLLFYKKLKTEVKHLEHSSHTIALSKGTIFAKKC